MDSTWEKKPRMTKRDVALNRGARAQEQRPHSADSTSNSSRQTKVQSGALLPLP
ncbi:hypothetical protein DPMN_114431 [Dreissena polymorpha]|uniref:Uncharacterized protein n=1 Tax=Dreissena polymorpha TaxID=45954 RepID=A0A9D4QS02_DREPO|nr:hypothetical protein DPMN_114431 [Dreissena polymorpha]